MKINYLLLYISPILFFATAISAQNSSSYSGEAAVPVIDGKIDDAEWVGAKVFSDFYITIPRSDEKYYDSTIVYVKQTKDAINFAFKWWPRGKVISKSFTRDRSTDEENEFFIMLDLENKNQNGYFFSFSFLNNQRDGIVYNQRSISYEWDWVWEAKSTIYREAKDGKPGYIESEVRIPVAKFQNKNEKQIGFDIQMFAYKPDGTLYTYSISPNSELLSVKNTYKFDLRYPFDEKINLNMTVSPYVVANKFNDKKPGATLGGDVNVSLNDHKLKGTVNTDQSTLEADPFRFTFYNRPVFLTEKRPFFSKDLDIYTTPINLFYTRSIDSITYGVNYTYRGDKLKAGIVYVEEPRYPDKKQYFVARPRLNLSDFNFGGLLIYTNDKQSDSKDRIISFDGLVRIPKTRFDFQGQIASNFGYTNNGTAYLLHQFYETSYAGGPYYDIMYDRVDKNFQTSTSFNSQIGAPNDYDETIFQPGYIWKSNRKYFSEINIKVSYYRLRQISSNFKYQEAVATELFYRLNDIINLDHYFEYNRPNDIDVNGNLIRRNNFDFNNSIKFLIGRSALYIGYECGPYFGSFIKHPYANIDLVLFDRISMLFAYDYRTVMDIKQSIFSAKLDWRIIPKLYFRSYYQQDTYNRLALWNTMLQYEFFAGSNVYLVIDLLGEKLQNTGRYFKLGYDFNF
ncbi:MAG: hypothetical protein ABSF32_03480 [Ignavibacteria bacterium]|jgi:hypothetical protein